MSRGKYLSLEEARTSGKIDRSRHDLQARTSRREKLASPPRPQPVAESHPRCKVQRRNRGRQIASSSRCRLTPGVTKIQRYLHPLEWTQILWVARQTSERSS